MYKLEKLEELKVYLSHNMISYRGYLTLFQVIFLKGLIK